MKETHLPLAPETWLQKDSAPIPQWQSCGVGETLQSVPEWTPSMRAPCSIQHVSGNLSSLDLSTGETLLFTELIFVRPTSY